MTQRIPEQRAVTADTVCGRLSRWLRGAVPMRSGSGGGFEASRQLAKWAVLGVVIGIVAGLGAVVFLEGIQLVTRVALGHIVDYLPPLPVGEGNHGITSIGRPWLLPLVVAAGGLISGIIVFTLAPEAEGHGTDSAIEAIHYKRGFIRARIPPIKLIASAITIGTGGSGGREGPTAQISAGFGSLLGRWLNLDPDDRRIAVAAGMGAGIGAIFRAPLGGAVLAAEILYIHDLEVEALIPGLVASIVGYSIFGVIEGFDPIFGAQPELGFAHPLTLVYYAGLGIVCGLGGLLYAKVFYGTAHVFHQIHLPNWLKPALGGLLVGLLGLKVAGALHTGYGWVQISMTHELLTLPLWLVLVLPFAKILATALSIGSGGSGGIFGPGMVIGAGFGAAFWRVGHAVLPQMPALPAPFVIIGMMALFGGIAHAPLSVMLMVAEMTGNLSLLAPAMVAVALSTAVVGDETIYRSQLPNRAASPAHRVRFSFPLLSSLLVRDAMAPPTPTVAATAPLTAAEAELETDKDSTGLAVTNAEHKIIGTLSPVDIADIPMAARATTLVQDVFDDKALMLPPDESLDHALEQMADRGASWALVVDKTDVVGSLTARDIVTAYRMTLQRSVRRVRTLAPSTNLFEARLAANSPLAGHTLRDAGLPRDTLVIAISRDGSTVFPRASTQLLPGDRVTILTNPASEPALRTFLEGGPNPQRPEPSSSDHNGQRSAEVTKKP